MQFLVGALPAWESHHCQCCTIPPCWLGGDSGQGSASKLSQPRAQAALPEQELLKGSRCQRTSASATLAAPRTAPGLAGCTTCSTESLLISREVCGYLIGRILLLRQCQVLFCFLFLCKSLSIVLTVPCSCLHHSRPAIPTLHFQLP